MANIEYLKYMKISEDKFKEFLNNIEEYLKEEKMTSEFLSLRLGGREFLFNGEIDNAIRRFEQVYEAIPDSEEDIKSYSNIIFLEAKICKRKFSKDYQPEEESFLYKIVEMPLQKT